MRSSKYRASRGMKGAGCPLPSQIGLEQRNYNKNVI